MVHDDDLMPNIMHDGVLVINVLLLNFAAPHCDMASQLHALVPPLTRSVSVALRFIRSSSESPAAFL